jgi:hypothetical protein
MNDAKRVFPSEKKSVLNERSSEIWKEVWVHLNLDCG